MREMGMTRSDLRAYDGKRLAALLTNARNQFHNPESWQRL